MNSVTIESTGKISNSNINAASGSAEDIQAAIDWIVAHGGIGNVYVPEGEFAFIMLDTHGVIIPGGVNVIGAGKDKTILRQTLPPEAAFMFHVDGSSGLPTRISGISFISYKVAVEDEPFTQGIYVINALDYRIDHCYFEDFTSKAILTKGGRGLIDHVDIDNPYKDDPNVLGGVDGGGRKVWGYGIIPVGVDVWRNADYYLGQYDGLTDIAYIENCNFSRTRHAIAGNGYGWYVVRHSIFYDPRPEHFGIIDVHGLGPGGRGLEAYNNSIHGSVYYWTGTEMDYSRTVPWLSIAVSLRGGSGVVYNNKFIDIHTGIQLLEEAKDPPVRIDDLWIWDNEMITQDAPPGQTGEDGTYLAATSFTEGDEYHLTQRPDYVAYTYPHPLALEP